MMMKSSGKTHNRYFNSRLYEALRSNFSIVMSTLHSGEKNPQYGSMWIYNLELKESKKIPKGDNIPDGWLKGRKMKFVDKFCKECNKLVLKGTIYCSEKCHKDGYSKTMNEKYLNGYKITRTKKANNKTSESQKGAKNTNAKEIKIYDDKDNIKFICIGNFGKVCKDNNLPYNAFFNSYKNDGAPIYTNSKANIKRLQENSRNLRMPTKH